MTTDFDERAVFVAGPVVVFQWRNEPGWPVDYTSPNAEEVFGYSAEEFRRGDVSYASLIFDDDAERVAREVQTASESDVTSFVHEPYRIRHRCGSVRWLYDSTRIRRKPDGSVALYLGYVIDITERMAAEEEKRELERRLLHAQKLESLGVLAGGVAHDFNNVLTGILGHAGLVRRHLDVTPGPARSGVDQIERLALRASALTRQLLAYAGKGRFVIEPLDLGEIVRDTVGMLELILPKNATLRLDLFDSIPAVMGDRGEIQQVVMNLLTNASEALEGDAGSVTLRTYRKEIGEAEKQAEFADEGLCGDYVCLEVSDTGCGMTDEVRQKLFDPFFTTKQSGRGLGMSAVLGIMRGHAGAVRITSKPGEGSTFRLLFPSSSHPKRVHAERPAPTSWRGTGTILIVDDERTVRWILGEVLTKMGFSPLVATNGAEAIDLYRKHKDDVVLALVDMTMPVMGGAATLAALRALSPALPIVMMSGYSEHHAVDQIETDARFTAFLEKPYGIEDVEHIVRRLLAPAADP